MIINKPNQCTWLDIWMPRYSDQYKDGERVALLAQYKVDQASPIIIINFTKAAHLRGQRFCIERKKAQRYPIDTNGKIPCYCVKMSALEHWETPGEILQIVEELWPATD